MTWAFTPTDVITVLGARGHGKTKLADSITAVYPRRVVIDRLREVQIEGENTHYFQDFDAYGNFIVESVRLEHFTAVFQFPLRVGNEHELFNEVLFMAYKRGHCLLRIEEVQNFARPAAMGLPEMLREFILTGRHPGTAFLCTSQRPAEVHKTIMSQSNHIFFGKAYEKNDLDYLKNYLGKDIEKLPRLDKRHFLHYRPGLESEIIVSPEIKTAHPERKSHVQR